MVILKPMLELSKTFMDPTGGEIMDQVLSYIPGVTNAIGNNDMVTIYRLMNETQTYLELLPPHIKQPQMQKIAIERIEGFKNVNTCLNQGKCGWQSYVRFLLDCVNPFKTLMSSLL